MQRIITPRAVILATTLFVAIAGYGCSGRQTQDDFATAETHTIPDVVKSEPPPEETITRPRVIIYNAVGRQRGSHLASAVSLVAWDDGLIVFREHCDDRSRVYKQGIVPPTAMDTFVEYVDRQKFSGEYVNYAVPNGSYTTIAIRSNREWTILQWDEIAHPQWGANVQPTDEYIAFIQQWSRLDDSIKKYLCGDITNIVDVEHEVIRGLDLRASGPNVLRKLVN